mmetsp:Transcript_6447/g.9499  ORF Transcript_6447/g.9499 Transcript_6447/m.9499 type:complete len:81 (-) Transcript_6447:212-454(-)
MLSHGIQICKLHFSLDKAFAVTELHIIEKSLIGGFLFNYIIQPLLPLIFGLISPVPGEKAHVSHIREVLPLSFAELSCRV